MTIGKRRRPLNQTAVADTTGDSAGQKLPTPLHLRPHAEAAARDARPFQFAFSEELGPQPGIPIVPERVLKAHCCFVNGDTRFKSAARLLQALWREDKQLAIGVHRDAAGAAYTLGSRIADTPEYRGANFLTSEIARLVHRELIYREIGAVIEEDRLRYNLLSSQTLTFNLFGALKLDLGFATAVVNNLFPGLIKDVTGIAFEHCPARGHAAFTSDGTAFDLVFKGLTPTGKRAFIAVEVKYSETTFETLPRFSGRFDAIAPASDLFVDPESRDLYSNPIQQLFRQGCLAYTMLDNELYDEGVHLLIAPEGNHLAQQAGIAYRRHLKAPTSGRLPFVSLTVESVVAAIGRAGAGDLANALHRRYCDWWLVDGELELDMEGWVAKPVIDGIAANASDANTR